MNLVKPEIKPRGQRILIEAEPEAMKEGLNLATCLRDAGYVAEFNLGGQEPANLGWTLEVRSKAPLFVLTDQAKHKKFEAQTASEVLATLREDGH